MFKSDELNEILQAELERGNEIAEDSSWPPKIDRSGHTRAPVWTGLFIGASPVFTREPSALLVC